MFILVHPCFIHVHKYSYMFILVHKCSSIFTVRPLNNSSRIYEWFYPSQPLNISLYCKTSFLYSTFFSKILSQNFIFISLNFFMFTTYLYFFVLSKSSKVFPFFKLPLIPISNSLNPFSSILNNPLSTSVYYVIKSPPSNSLYLFLCYSHRDPLWLLQCSR